MFIMMMLKMFLLLKFYLRKCYLIISILYWYNKIVKWDTNPRPTDPSPMFKGNHSKTKGKTKRIKKTTISPIFRPRSPTESTRRSIHWPTNSSWSTRSVSQPAQLTCLSPRNNSQTPLRRSTLRSSSKITQVTSWIITAKPQFVDLGFSTIMESAVPWDPKWSTGWSKSFRPTRWVKRLFSAVSTWWIATCRPLKKSFR